MALPKSGRKIQGSQPSHQSATFPGKKQYSIENDPVLNELPVISEAENEIKIQKESTVTQTEISTTEEAKKEIPTIAVKQEDPLSFINNEINKMIEGYQYKNKTITFRPKTRDKMIIYSLLAEMHVCTFHSPTVTFIINLALKSLKLIYEKHPEIRNELITLREEIAKKDNDTEKEQFLEDYFLQFFEKHLK